MQVKLISADMKIKRTEEIADVELTKPNIDEISILVRAKLNEWQLSYAWVGYSGPDTPTKKSFIVFRVQNLMGPAKIDDIMRLVGLPPGYQVQSETEDAP